MKKILFTTFTFLLLVGCDVFNPYGDNSTGTTSQPSTSCIAGVPLPLTFPLGKRNIGKILLSENSFTKKKTKFLKNNLELMVVHDVECVQKIGSFVESNKSFNFQPGSLYSLNPKKMSMGYHASKLVTQSTYSFESFQQLVENDSCIKYVENILQFKALAVPNDPLYNEAAHLDFLNAPTAWDTFYHLSTGISENIVIAVIDTGGDFDHPDLIANVWTNPGETPSNATDDDGNGYTDDINGYNFVTDIGDPTPEPPPTGNTDHGTNVAGAAAARMDNNIGAAGIMGLFSKIMHLNIAGPNETMSSLGLFNALNYATDNGADIINLSLGINNQTSTALTDAIQNAVDNNIVVVTAAGNDAEQQTNSVFSYPGTPLGSQIDGVINVGSIDTSSDQMSSFSNYSDVFVEIMAPGSENSATGTGIFMPDPGSDPTNSYDDSSGTSFSAPIVAGAVGLIIGLLRTRGDNPTPAQVEDILKSNAVSNGSLSGRVENCNSLNLEALASGL